MQGDRVRGVIPEGARPSYDPEASNPDLSRPTIVSDPLRALDNYAVSPDYKHWDFGREKVTVFLEEGSETTDVGAPEWFDGIVPGCQYINANTLPSSRTADGKRVYERVWQQPEIIAFSGPCLGSTPLLAQAVLREVLEDPALELRHMLSGTRAGGWGDLWLGFSNPAWDIPTPDEDLIAEIDSQRQTEYDRARVLIDQVRTLLSRTPVTTRTSRHTEHRRPVDGVTRTDISRETAGLLFFIDQGSDSSLGTAVVPFVREKQEETCRHRVLRPDITALGPVEVAIAGVDIYSVYGEYGLEGTSLDRPIIVRQPNMPKPATWTETTRPLFYPVQEKDNRDAQRVLEYYLGQIAGREASTLAIGMGYIA